MTCIWNTEEVFLSGDDYFHRILEDIEAAKSFITLEFYIFNDDILGRAITEVLIEAARRGVRIQIIIDGVGSYGFVRRLYPAMVKENISVKIYNPLPFLQPYHGSLNFKQKLQALGMRLLRLNKRDHRKIITIDEDTMYCGSFNITAEHTRMLGVLAWKDMGMRVTGPHVRYAVLNFKRGWKLKDYYQYRKKNKSILIPWKKSPLRFNTTIFMKRYFKTQFLNNVKGAKRRVWLMTPYFIPKRSLIRAMAQAAQRGVDVRLILSTKSDVELFIKLQTFYYPFLIKSGVKIYLYHASVLHAKTYIFDDWMTVGSSNLNHRSLMHDLEVDLVVQREENRKIVEDDFIHTMKSFHPLDEEYLEGRSIMDKLMTRLFFTFRYWL